MVKPQGKKKVNAPIIKGIYFPLKLFSFATYRVTDFGIENWNLRNPLTPNICNANPIINSEMPITKNEVNPKDICNRLPISPRTPPNRAYDKTLPTLNIICG